jgi:hypothetical protein
MNILSSCTLANIVLIVLVSAVLMADTIYIRQWSVKRSCPIEFPLKIHDNSIT